MAHRGKEFEKLVSIVERALSGTGASVRSPDYILDVDSGEKREVDVSVRFRVGSNSMLIVIECRDRAEKADVTWIEQLISKRRSVKADKLVAVSAKGFTAPALEKAAREGIEARVLKKLKPKDVKGWVTNITISMTLLSYKALGGDVTMYNNLEKDLGEPDIRWTDENGQPLKLFSHQSSEGQLNVAQLFEMLRQEEGFRPFQESQTAVWIERRFERGVLSIQTSKGKYYVEHIKMGFEVKSTTTGLALEQGHEYTSGTELIARHMKFGGQVDVQGKPLRVEISTTVK